MALRNNVKCQNYEKIGACRHGKNCQNLHISPTFSPTVLLKNFYTHPFNPYVAESKTWSTDAIAEQKYFEEFYEDVFVECREKYGKILQMVICANQASHLVGNVYIRFSDSDDARRASAGLNKRWFAGRPIYAELSPVADLRIALCQESYRGECTRGTSCTYLHARGISTGLQEYLFNESHEPGSDTPSSSTSRSSSRSPRDLP